MAAQATTPELTAELDPYNPPSNPKAPVAAAIIGVLVILFIVLAVLYGWGQFSDINNIQSTLDIQGNLGPRIEPLLNPGG